MQSDLFSVKVERSPRAVRDLFPFTSTVRRSWNGGSDIVASGAGATAEAALLDGLRLLGEVAPDADDVSLGAGEGVSLRMGDGRTIAPGKWASL